MGANWSHPPVSVSIQRHHGYSDTSNQMIEGKTVNQTLNVLILLREAVLGSDTAQA